METRVFLRIEGIERQAHRVGAQDAQLTRIRDTDIAVDVQKIKVLLAQRHTERVDRADARLR